jgi:hypothetical protein
MAVKLQEALQLTEVITDYKLRPAEINPHVL